MRIHLANRLYLSYIRGVDYIGLNEAIQVTFAIYHMAKNIGASVDRYCLSTTPTQLLPLTPNVIG